MEYLGCSHNGVSKIVFGFVLHAFLLVWISLLKMSHVFLTYSIVLEYILYTEGYSIFLYFTKTKCRYTAKRSYRRPIIALLNYINVGNNICTFMHVVLFIDIYFIYI